MLNINFGLAPKNLPVEKIVKEGLSKEKKVVSEVLNNGYTKFDGLVPKHEVKLPQVEHTRFDAPYEMGKKLDVSVGDSIEKYNCPPEAWY